MKKILTGFFIMFCTVTFANASGMPDLKYKNIGIKDKITYDIETNSWSKNTDKKNLNYFVKTEGFGDFYDYLDADKNFAFSTNCEYEFIYNNSFIGFSNRDMKFYEILYDNKTAGKRALTKEEVEAILQGYTVIPLSEFSPKTNSLKVKKNSHPMKIFLYNDTENTFDEYSFTSGNTKFEQYDLRGFLTVHKPGMVQFSNLSEPNDTGWYVLLIR